jgi:hypothetical protein
MDERLRAAIDHWQKLGLGTALVAVLGFFSYIYVERDSNRARIQQLENELNVSQAHLKLAQDDDERMRPVYEKMLREKDLGCITTILNLKYKYHDLRGLDMMEYGRLIAR